MNLPIFSANHCQGFAEIDLRMSRVVAQQHEHLALPLAPLVHVVLYNGDPTRSKESARKALVEAGIYTKSGKLTKNYR